MTSKERLLLAINREKPDRLPVTVHQWQSYHLNKYLDGISELEAFKKFGMDASVQYFEEMGQFWLSSSSNTKLNNAEWKEEVVKVSTDPENRISHHTITTPEGILRCKTGGNTKTTWITEYIIKKNEDIYLIKKYMPVPKLTLSSIEKVYDNIGDDGILRGFVWGDQASCWQHAACLIDINDLIIKSLIEPDWVHELLKILLDKKLQFIENMKGAKFDLIETGGGSASSTLISPDIHKEFCLPYDIVLHDALHNLGFKISNHICGGNLGIEEYIVQNGADVMETLAGKSIGGNQEPWDFKEKVGNRIALIGGIDQFNVLTGSDELIKKQVIKLFEKVGYDGGFIISCTDHFFETPLEKLKVFANSAKECRY